MGNATDRVAIAGLAFTLTILPRDLIPNGLWACSPFFLAGGLSRRLREVATEESYATTSAMAVPA